MIPPDNDTIAALATPAGESAIALVRVSGPLARGLASQLLAEVPLPRLAVHADYRDHAGKVVDDVLITLFVAPNSYTGEDTLEISTHGSPYISQRVLEDLFARGCRPAEPGEFTKRAFLLGRMDLSQAEAVMDLIHARSERALEAANRQLRGALGREIARLIDRLIGVVAEVEAYIDFPEDDLPAENRERLILSVNDLQADVGRMLATGRYGSWLREGVRTVIVGAPNAGKSSLLNRLLGWERALVSPEPGTTRDFLEEPLVLGPHRLRLIDTAGLNPAPAELERRGIERTLERAEEADLFLVVLDAASPSPALPAAVANRLLASNTVIVWNKTDLAPPGLPPPEWREFASVAVSAHTGDGLDRLVSKVCELIDKQSFKIGDDLVAINARHATDLAAAVTCLREARAKLETMQPDELMAADLRGALDALGRIGGRVDHERVLDRIFATFCIGK